jgi:pilus assembly protein CpaF
MMSTAPTTARTSAVSATPGAREARFPDRAALVERIAARLAEESDGRAGVTSPERRMLEVLIGHWLEEEFAAIDRSRIRSGVPVLDSVERRDLRDAVVADVLGAGPLERWLRHPDVEEIDVNSHRSTWVTFADGRKTDLGRLWDSAEELTAFQKRFARRATATGEGRLDTASPTLTMQTSDGARVVMVLGGVGERGVSPHPRIAIRRSVTRQVGLAGLAERGLFPPHLVPVLAALARTGFTILISGPPGAGKTTLLTELLGEVDAAERIVTVEKHLLELRLEEDPRHPDAPALHTRGSNSEGEGEISTRELVELTRRLNPDRVVIGELVEDEALDMLDVASMCARGSMATIHAHSASVVLDRLAYYVAKSDTGLPEFAVWNLISQTVDFVVHIDLVRNTGAAGAPLRRITSIIEVGGLAAGAGVASSEVFSLHPPDLLRQVGPVSSRRLRRMELAGEDPALLTTWDSASDRRDRATGRSAR